MIGLAQPFFICLILSLIWAPFVLLCALQIQRKHAPTAGGKLWPTALGIAALPAIFAPIFASVGFSLRTQPVVEPAIYASESIATITAVGVSMAPTRTIDAALLLDAAVALYVYGFILFFILGAARFVSFSHRTRYAFDIDNQQLIDELDAWSNRMGLRRKPAYKYCDAVTSVCVYGFFRPKLLMPAKILDRLSVNDVVLMGAHELAHVKRRDTWLFAFTAMTRAVFWFNPFMRNIAARAILAAEQAADRLVLLRGAKQREYARCFVNGLRNSAGLTRTDYELAPSFTPFDKKSRRERLNAILSADSHSPFGSRKAKALAIAGGFAAIGLAFAQAAFVVEPSEVRASLPQAPVDGKVTLGYKETSVALGDDRSAHEGVDIKAKRGAPVMAAGDGKVVAATSRYNNQPAWGKVVVIDHGHGLITRYAHLDNFVVTRGDVVLAGDTIGAVGSTGRSTGPHLHFEVLRDGEPVDPSPVIAAKPLPKPELKFEPVIAPKIEHALSIEPPIILASAAHDLMPIYDVSPAIMPAPTPDIDQEEIEKRLEGRFDELTARMSARFKDEEFVRDFDLDGYEFEGADELSAALTKELAQEFADMRLSLAEIEGLNFDAFEFDGDGMLRFNGEFSEEEIARLKEEQHEAIERAHKEMERAHREAEKARQKKHRHAERERQRQMRLAERARETAERDRERSKHDADRARERAERDMERALERAEMRAERDFERLEREWERNPSEKYEGIDEEELLDIREKALREAQANLDAELKEIERERKRLNKKRKARNKD